MYSTKTVNWFENQIPMRDPHQMTNRECLAMADAIEVQHEDAFIGEEWLDSFLAAPILGAKYEKLNIREFILGLNHLNREQKDDIEKLLTKHEKLFDGTLGLYPHKKVQIEIDPEAKPVHSRPYAVPIVHRDVFRKELENLVKRGVLSRTGESEWASPSFIIPKKDGRVRWISDLRALNKVIKRKQYPLPIIQDVLKKRSRYAFFTKLDISMQYYTFELDEKSKDLCTIVTPFGKYRYNRLPMGLKCAPDFAQEVMENLMRDIEDADVYLDDVGAFSKSWEHHMKLLDQILTRLEENGFTVNPSKCEWAVQETDWLGYWLTPNGLKPWKKKIDAVLKMQAPKNLKELRGFVGCVNYYRDMWPQRSHILAPLTDQTGKKKFVWNPEMQTAFEKMKALLATDALCAYPDHNLPFEIYTDASDLQLGAVIVQNGRPVAYYSKKLTSAQKNYTTMEKELLSIVMTLKEFRSMLLGARITVFTDHKNLTFENLKTQRVLRWRTYVEEYSPELKYFEGRKNVVADTFSRLPRDEHQNEDKNVPILPPKIKPRLPQRSGRPLVGKNDPASVVKKPNTDKIKVNTRESVENINKKVNEATESFNTSIFEDPEILDCFLALENDECHFLPFEHEGFNPLDLRTIQEEQKKDSEFNTLKQKNPEQFKITRMGKDLDILVYVKPGLDAETQWRICLPKNMVKDAVKWFHLALGHPGYARTYDTMRSRYYSRHLSSECRKFKCEDCQKHKADGRGWGLLPEREVTAEPFEDVVVDLIGS